MPKTNSGFNTQELSILLNEWMRRYTEEPEKFEAEFRTVGEFLEEMSAGKEPSYGEECVEYLLRLREEM